MTMTPAEADTNLSVGFASRALGPALPAGESVAHRAPLANVLVNTAGPGGRRAAGQAPTAAAGTSAVIAAPTARGAFAPMTLVGRSTAFQRAVTGSDVLIEAVRTKPGRRTRLAPGAEKEQKSTFRNHLMALRR